MFKKISHSVVFAACILALSAPLSFAYVSPGNPTGFVNDFAGVLSGEQKNTLEQTLEQNKTETGNEIVVVTVENLGGDTVENFAEKLFQEWGIGEEGKDNGALLLVALEDRAMRIEVGYGLEGALTDSIAGKIIRNDITPQFRDGNYYEGIRLAVDQMIAVTKGEGYAGSSALSENVDIGEWIPQAFFFIFFFFQWVGSILARSKSWWLGGVIGACIGVGIWVFTTPMIGLVSGALLTLFGLLLDFIVSREYTNSKAGGRTPRWWAGGSGFRGGGGGFGGFGGGRSGGGGASGRW
ncbi:MAG: hypothetical protein A2591_03580 [Candidatus Yonathbacteria bacterium RIFOXYD1_FULL_52_36]|uniref:TPM domain-containing protein n=1 Tax=Candidatus Yonathbacteria bacterium RIFOXYD1_FULL_52_36 TaxID=1802730 RepID=A0A1G2SN37_9BACT|nr:MAG: hypothetical protein A2591_03580 [Candidatus Yonathbacteria bacterium RIFOXYD1_FULL_52_36]